MEQRKIDRRTKGLVPLAAAVLLSGTPALAQNSEGAASPPLTDLGNFRLPPAGDGRAPGVEGPSNNGLPPLGPAESAPDPVRPAIVRPVPVSVPVPVAPERSVDRPRPAVSAPPGEDASAAEDRVGSDVTAAPSDASQEAAPTLSPSPAAEADADTAPSLSPISARVIQRAESASAASWWKWAGGLALLLLGGLYGWSRRRVPVLADGGEPVPVAAPRPVPRPPVPAPPVPAPPKQKSEPASALMLDQPEQGSAPLVTRAQVESRADISISLEIARLEMTPEHLRVHFALQLFNRGTAIATGAMARIALQQAASGQDALLVQFFDGVGGSLVRDNIEVAAGARETISGEAILPRERVQPLVIAGKPALVPVLAFDITYHWDGPGDAFGQVASAFVVGRETAEDGGKLAPLRLDQAAYVVSSPGARATAMQRKI